MKVKEVLSKRQECSMFTVCEGLEEAMVKTVTPVVASEGCVCVCVCTHVPCMMDPPA